MPRLLALSLILTLAACATTQGPPTEPNDREWSLLSADYAWIESLRKAQALVREGKAQEAVELIGPGLAFLQGRDLLRARVTLARAYMKIPKWLRRAEEVLQAVLHEAPDLAEAHVAIGDLYLATNQRARAASSFRRALEVDPKNAEARERLEAAGGGAKNEPPPPPPSTFKKIFGKR